MQVGSSLAGDEDARRLLLSLDSMLHMTVENENIAADIDTRADLEILRTLLQRVDSALLFQDFAFCFERRIVGRAPYKGTIATCQSAPEW